KLLLIGKTTDKNLQKLTDQYAKRLKHYINFKMEALPELKNQKNLSEKLQKAQESELILKKLHPSDEVVLLDEKGKAHSSVEFSKWLQKQMLSGKKQLVFVVGGPYGFSPELYRRADQKLALSK